MNSFFNPGHGGVGGSVAGGLAILAMAVTIGLSIGAIQFRKLKLGISGVLFASLLFGQLGLTIDPNVLGFLSSFALIVFMYAMGLELGPGFVVSLRAEGLRLNVLAFIVVALAAIMTVAVAPLLRHANAPGLFSGALTTTPGLAAAQEVFRGASHPSDGPSAAARAALAYSITYPCGVVGPMLVIVTLRRLFRVSIDRERAELAADERERQPRFEAVDIEVPPPP